MTNLVQEIKSANTQFALQLFSLAFANSLELPFGEGHQTVQLSPFSVRRALTMANIGARGNTRKAILDAMNYPVGTDLADVNEHNRTLADYLTSVESRGPSPVELSLANALWLKQDDLDPLHIVRQFIVENANFLNAQCEGLRFDEAALEKINAWCRKQTNGKIDSILDSISPEAVAFLTDALYMKAPAKERFYEINDKEGNFFDLDGTASPVTYMRQQGSFDYLKSDGVQLLQFPFGQQGYFNYYLILPDLESSLSEAVKSFLVNWQAWIQNLRSGYGILRISQNEQEWSRDLTPELMLQGMGIAFSEDADFSGICTNKKINIGSVNHKTFTKLTHKGFEGAAVTAVDFHSFGIGAPAEEIFDITANRPYIWVVTGGDEILFVGTTTNPVQPELQEEADSDETEDFDDWGFDGDDDDDLGDEIDDDRDLSELH